MHIRRVGLHLGLGVLKLDSTTKVNGLKPIFHLAFYGEVCLRMKYSVYAMVVAVAWSSLC